MAKKDKSQPQEAVSQEMTSDEAKAYRASLHKPTKKKLTMQEKREAFRLFWAKEKAKYGKKKDLEGILWMHLVSSKLDEPEDFTKGVSHFGLKKIK
jgi:hypothetical protein